MFSNLFNGKYGKLIKGALIAFCLYQIFRFVMQMVGMAKAKISDTVVKQQTGITDAEMQLCNEVAVKVYDSIYNYVPVSWFFGGLAEDEPTIIAQLNRLTTVAQAKAVSLTYQTFDKGTYLKDDLTKYLNERELSQIKSHIKSNL